jgi:hypothetical protein
MLVVGEYDERGQEGSHRVQAARAPATDEGPLGELRLREVSIGGLKLPVGRVSDVMRRAEEEPETVTGGDAQEASMLRTVGAAT